MTRRDFITVLGAGAVSLGAFAGVTLAPASRAGSVWAETSSHFADKTKFRKAMSDFGIELSPMSADALISRDRGFLRKWFKALKVIDPSKPSAAL